MMDSEKNIKGKMKINRSMPTEYLLNNIIDKDFQAVLLPFRILQSIFLILKCRILNNFITPEVNTSCYIKSMLGSSLLVLSHFIRYRFYIDTLQDFGSGINGLVKFLLYFDVSFYSLVSVMIYIDSAFKRNHVVELIMKLQKVVNSIIVDKKAFFFKHRIHNWFCVLSLVSMYTVNMLLSSDDLGFLSLLVSFSVAASMLFLDINILNVTCTIVMIKNLLVAWTRALREYKNDKAEGENSEQVMFNAYVDIITAFHLCNKVYQFSFMYFAFETFIYTLITVESVIEFGSSSSDESLYHASVRTVLTVLWNIKNFILIATLSVACDNFYGTVKLGESACAQILSDADGQAAGMRKTCKNVMRLNRAVLQKLSAFGAFQLDAAFPLRLLGGLVAYTVVLLQFAFL